MLIDCARNAVAVESRAQTPAAAVIPPNFLHKEIAFMDQDFIND
jgi:hypothetical protein